MGSIPEKSEGGVDDDDTCLKKKMTYEPVKTFQELITYGETLSPTTSQSTNEVELSLNLSHKKPPCTGRNVPLNKNFSDVKVTLDGRRIKGEDCPKTLVCHDFKGGYGDDKYVEGTDNQENYIFRHWLQTDIFCYFSHHFVTIPPLGWINAGHSHGVKIIGTIITEWNDGVALCDEILKDSNSIDKSVEKLCKIAKDFGFEGYLVNIENELKEPQVPLMLEFLEKLNKALKKSSQDNLVIWYDSVTVEGKLKWQDSLNDLNKQFFKACDGIYLNYGWNDEKLKCTREAAGNRKFDVYVGIDVFGRDCFGGGGLNTCQAVEKVWNHQLSYAIFAPGWSFECHDYDSYSQTDDALWIPCSKYFYFRCLKDEFHQTDRFALLSPNVDSTSKKFRVFLSTNFSRGYGSKSFTFGQEPVHKPWFNLNLQSYQPVIFLSSGATCYDEKKWDKVSYETGTGFSGGGSLRICNSKRRPDYENPLKFSPIWFPLNIPLSSSRMSIAVLAAWKSASVQDQLHIYLEVTQKNAQVKKILLGSVDHLAASVAGKYYIHLKLSHFLQEEEAYKLEKDKEVEFFFKKNNYDEKEVCGWRISCFLFDLDENQKYCGINSIRVGAEGDCSLGYLSLAQIIHYTDLE